MDEKKPVKLRELTWTKQGETYLLLDKNTQKTYTLDPITFLVWIQCDGKTNVEQIVDVFAVNGNRDIVKAAIVGILDKLVENGLLKMV